MVSYFGFAEVGESGLGCAERVESGLGCAERVMVEIRRRRISFIFQRGERERG